MDKMTHEQAIAWIESEEGKASINKAIEDAHETVKEMQRERKKLQKQLKDFVIDI